jgi:hypothetical protein
MSRDTFIQQVKRGLATASVIAGGLIAVTALVRPSIAFIDGRYVHQIEYVTQRTLDSLARAHEMDEMRRTMATVDTGVKCLRKVLPRRDCEK